MRHTAAAIFLENLPEIGWECAGTNALSRRNYFAKMTVLK